MTKTLSILITLTPACVSLLLYIKSKYFQPPLGHPSRSKAPVWWSRDQATWDKAHQFLSQKYGIGTVALFAICGCLLFISSPYAMYGGYVALIAYVLLAHYQVRVYMMEKVK